MLASELPINRGDSILYPTSAKAGSDIEVGLTERGCHVTRLNIYDTTSTSFTPTQTSSAQSSNIVAFASPSGVRGWFDNVGCIGTAVCIGSTSKKECLR